jgi:Ser/Thr protein kinase RdoA (MazF antagonist)
VEQSELAIDSLAKFHAAWWESPGLQSLDWMPFVNAPVHQSAQQSYQQAWAPFCEAFGEKLSPRMMAIGDEMREHVIDLLNYLEPSPRTIIHGDFRGDNVFFGDGETRAPFYAIDWQISCKGRGIFDVAYFLCTSVDPAIRKRHEMRLIRSWYDAIGATNDLSGYSFDQAVEDYRVSALYMHVYTVIALGTLDFANERGLMLFNEWLHRRATAIEDLDCDDIKSKVW